MDPKWLKPLILPQTKLAWSRWCTPICPENNNNIRGWQVFSVSGFVLHWLEFKGDAASTTSATSGWKDTKIVQRLFHSFYTEPYCYGNLRILHFEFLTVCSPEFGGSQSILLWVLRLLGKLCASGHVGAQWSREGHYENCIETPARGYFFLMLFSCIWEIIIYMHLVNAKLRRLSLWTF